METLPGQARSTVAVAIIIVGVGWGTLVVLDRTRLGLGGWILGILLWAMAVLFGLYAVRQAATELKSTRRASEQAAREVSEAARQVKAEVKAQAGELRDEFHRHLGGKPRPAGLAIGCRLGRGVVEVGLLQFVEVAADALPRRAHNDFMTAHGPGVTPVTFRPDTGDRNETYDAITRGIAAAARSQDDTHLDYLGVGLPGLIDLPHGVLYRAMSGYGFANQESIRDHLAHRLYEDATVRARFGAVTEDDLRERIFVDNDVRCASRALLATRASAPPDFACFHIGTGVGSSFVLGGRLHYGSRTFAGEIGHSTVHLGEQLELPTCPIGAANRPKAVQAFLKNATATRLDPRRCSCGGGPGFHLETLLNYDGLLALADALSPERLKSLQELFERDRAGPAEDGNRDFGRNGLPAALESAFSRRAETPYPSLHDAIRDPKSSDLRDYLDALTYQYTCILALVIGSLINTLDLEKVVLCGSLIERLGRTRMFPQYLSESLSSCLINPGLPNVEYANISDLAWCGAALTGRDPDYPGSSGFWE